MIKKLRRRLTLLFLIPTSLILSLILLVLFFWQASLTRNEQAVNLQNQILNLTYQLEGAYFFSDDWLAGLEYDYRMIIHIEDNRVPLLFSGSWSPRTDRDVLIELAKEQARKEHIDTSARPYSSTMKKSSIFTVHGRNHDTYQGIVVILATEDGFRSLTMLSDITELKRQEPRRLLFFLGVDILGILALFLISRFVASKAASPVAEYHRKQTDFIAAASHELRSPLAVIQNCAAASLSMPELTGKMNRLILSECIRSGKLIKNLLWLTSADTGKNPRKPAPVEIDLLLLRLFETYEPLCYSKNIRLRLLLTDEMIPCVSGNSQWIYQLFSIFLDNAIAYGCTGAGNFHGGKPSIEICARVEGRKVAVSVSDHGPGIPKGQKDMIFDRFYRSDASRKEKEHFGLGLSIAQSLAAQLGVGIEVLDTEGGGCTFRVEFGASGKEAVYR